MKLTADDELVITALQEADRPMLAREISEAAGINYDRTTRSVRWLGYFGRLEKVGHRWRLAPGHIR